jgi:hypothetical protein
MIYFKNIIHLRTIFIYMKVSKLLFKTHKHLCLLCVTNFIFSIFLILSITLKLDSEIFIKFYIISFFLLLNNIFDTSIGFFPHTPFIEFIS